MEFQVLRCPYCASEGRLKRRDNLWFCSHCGNECSDDLAEREYRRLESKLNMQLEGIVDEAFKKNREEKYYNLRSILWDKIHATYIDSEAVVEVCRDIKKLEPHDFLAGFFEAANSAPTHEVADLINEIDVREGEMFLGVVIDFMIRSLKSEYIMPTGYLIERAYKNTDLEKFEKFVTKFEAEAQKVDTGVYSTMIPRDVFIAYSSKDIERVMELCAELEENGLSCFVAMRNLQHGRDAVANYRTALREAMNHAKMVIFVSSKNSRSLSCDALTEELAYIRESELASAPAEYRNNYASMPEQYKKPRIEYRIDNRNTGAAESVVREFFANLDFCESTSKVVARAAELKLRSNVAPEIKAPKSEPAKANTDNVASSTALNPLLRRIFMFLEDGEFDSAAEYCERVLDSDPENAQAYLGKLMVDLGVKTEGELANLDKPFDDNLNYKKILHYSDKTFADTIEGWNDSAYERFEIARKEAIYNDAMNLMELKRYQAASSVFNSIPDYKDSKQQLDTCNALKQQQEQDRLLKNKARSRLIKIIALSFISLCLIAALIICIAISAVRKKNNYLKFEELSDGTYAIVKSFNKLPSDLIIPSDHKGKKVTSIGSYAFCDCDSLTSVTIPDSVTSIGDNAFYDCTNLTSVHITDVAKWCGISFGNFDANPLYYVHNLYLNGELVTELEIPDSVTSIGDYAFQGCTSLTRVTIPDSVTSIGYYAFYDCTSLKSITIPDGVTSIGSFAFEICTGLTSVTIPDSVTSIGRYAFCACTSLEQINYRGTAGQWSAITKGSGWDVYAGDYEIIYNYKDE